VATQLSKDPLLALAERTAMVGLGVMGRLRANCRPAAHRRNQRILIPETY